jgi:hypothetical protein
MTVPIRFTAAPISENPTKPFWNSKKTVTDRCRSRALVRLTSPVSNDMPTSKAALQCQRDPAPIRNTAVGLLRIRLIDESGLDTGLCAAAQEQQLWR